MTGSPTREQAEALIETVRRGLDVYGNGSSLVDIGDADEALDALAAAVSLLVTERDEAREIVEKLRRHGGDWIVEAAGAQVAALVTERDALRESLEAAEHEAGRILFCSVDKSAADIARAIQVALREALAGGGRMTAQGVANERA